MFNLTFNFKRIFFQRILSRDSRRSWGLIQFFLSTSPLSVQLLVRSFSFAQWILVSRLITLAGCGGRRLGPRQGDILWSRWRWKTVWCETKEINCINKNTRERKWDLIKIRTVVFMCGAEFGSIRKTFFYGVYFSSCSTAQHNTVTSIPPKFLF